MTQVVSAFVRFKARMKRGLFSAMEWLTRPTLAERYGALVGHVMSLELSAGEFVSLSPVGGVHGQIKLSGTGIPTFHYTLFDDDLMEFVFIQAFVVSPTKIGFTATTPDLGAIPTKPGYEAPLHLLIGHLCRYFPFYTKPKAVA